MIHRLRRIELGDRRQDAERVAGQHDDVLGVTGAARRRGVGDEIQRIGDAGVLGLAVVIEVGQPQFGIERDVFHHRAEALGGRSRSRARPRAKA